jgi:hypothetical protein
MYNIDGISLDSNPSSRYYEMDTEVWQTVSWMSTAVQPGRRRELRRAVGLALPARPVASTSNLIYKVLLAFVDKALTVRACVCVWLSYLRVSSLRLWITLSYICGPFFL